jgi:hypothetical protein
VEELNSIFLSGFACFSLIFRPERGCFGGELELQRIEVGVEDKRA